MINETDKKNITGNESPQDGTKVPAPIKRNEALKPFSREHHHGLLFSWKIRQGIKKNIEPARLRDYSNWFWQHFLLPHFEAEEKFLFPIAGKHNVHIQKALTDHKEIKNLFEDKNAGYEAFSHIGKILDAHIRFEERILFNEVQESATDEQLNTLISLHKGESILEEWKDVFWD